MFDKLRSLWDNWGFELVFGIAIVVILILALFRIGKTGSFTELPRYIPKDGLRLTQRELKNHGPPTESKGEIECRRVMESLFNAKFPKARPDFLRNPVTSRLDSGNNLEIDCFNSELRLGVEYNGIQHYKYSTFFHKNYEAFRNQQYRDEMKKFLCKENGIKLIEVPYTVKNDEIEIFIAKELALLGYAD